MESPALKKRVRIESIDILRGIVMVIMALDHTRDYFNNADPLNFATTTPLLFFTRWITHYCAPIFVFLSGTSAYLQSLRKSPGVLQSFLIKRGLWLIFIEVVVITLAWTFDPLYHLIILQVIWAIGISMVVLGLLVRLPVNAIGLIGLAVVLGHNLLDIPEGAAGFQAGFWWDLLHHGRFSYYPLAAHHGLIIVYAFVPWTGLMLLGYWAGVFFSEKYSPERRKRILARIGIGLIAGFVILRGINMYGNPEPWSTQKNGVFTLLSFLNVHKYPPSLMYSCMTLGPAFLLLSLFEGIRNRFTRNIEIYGRVAFFYYVIHLYLLHTISVIFFFARGHSLQEGAQMVPGLPRFYFLAARDGYSLLVVYVIWISVVVALFPLCKWYDQYKRNHREKWWLSYL
ncbi:MAG: DUF1624 domain-containing protein [Bacteroidota bacterium]|nr:DUF1624 domain-containing protein [Bacteroidota bacterium]